MLCSDRVLAFWDPERETMVWVDDGPDGLGATLTQNYQVEGMDHPSWRPVNYTSRAKTPAEKNYPKVDGESLGILFGILSNKMFLYGTKFGVMVDHQPLVALYNKKSKSLPVRVGKHQSTLAAFDFSVSYEPGYRNPDDFLSRDHPVYKGHSEEDKLKFGVEDEEDEAEVVIRRLDELTDAVTLLILSRYSKEDETTKQIYGCLGKGTQIPRHILEQGFKGCQAELSQLRDGIIIRGEKIYIPALLRPDVLDAAHQGHPGRDGMLRQLCQSVWWPGISKDVKEFVETCKSCSASTTQSIQAPMEVRQTPEYVWQDVSVDYKGPIGGDYYLHVMICNLSRYPVVQVTKDTKFSSLLPQLEDTFSMYGIPESVTSVNGPPYNSDAWAGFARSQGFHHRRTTSLHPEGNGLAEKFMGVLVKTIHTAQVDGVNPKQAVKRQLLNYRNTPHPSTGVAQQS